MTLKDAMRLAAESGDWVTAYALLLVQAQWMAGAADTE